MFPWSPIRRMAAGTVVALLLSGCCAMFGIDCPENEAERFVPAGPFLTITEGDGQRGYAGEQLPRRVVVRLTGSTFNQPIAPLPDRTIRWSVFDDGAVSASETRTDADGKATVEWTLGTISATQYLGAELVANGPPLSQMITAYVEHPDFDVEVTSPTLIQQACGAVLPVLIRPAGGKYLVSDIVLQLQTPQGITGPGTITLPRPVPPEGVTAEFTLQADERAAVGSFPGLVTAASAANNRISPAEFQIVGPPCHFSLEFTAGHVELARGGPGSVVTVGIQRTGSATGPIFFELTGLDGVVADPPDPATPAATSAEIRLRALGTAPLGEHALTLHGRTTLDGEQVERTAPVPVRITDALVLTDDFEGAADRWVVQAREYRRDDAGISHPAETPWTHSLARLAAGGSPGAYRRMTHTLAAETAPEFVSIFVEHTFGDGAGNVYQYDPRIDGAISSLDFEEDRIAFQHNVYGTLLVRQAGIVYVLAPGVLDPTFANTAWERVTRIGLTAANFQAAVGYAPATPPRPDFSANGVPIQFGFIRGTTARFPITHVNGIDNWKLTIRR